jgi:hypothetical protein
MCVNDSADSPARERDEIEVTPEMIAAGEYTLSVIVDSPDARPGLITRAELKAAYIAMRRLEPIGRPRSPHVPL